MIQRPICSLNPCLFVRRGSGLNNMTAAETSSNLAFACIKLGKYKEVLPLLKHFAATTQITAGIHSPLATQRWDMLGQAVLHAGTFR